MDPSHERRSFSRRLIMSEVIELADYLRGENECTDEEVRRMGQMHLFVCEALGIDASTVETFT